ncbi:MAG: DUF6020 family protein [Bacilli bacterium]
MNIKNNKILYYIFLTLASILSVCAIFINIPSFKYISQIYQTFEYLTFGVAFIFIFIFFKLTLFKNKKINIPFTILSILFSIFMLIGYTFSKTNSFDLLFSSIPNILYSIIKFLGHFIFIYASLNIIYKFIKKIMNKEYLKNKKIIKLLDNHPIIFTSIILLICWLPYMISFYPGVLSPDPVNQLEQYYGVTTYYSSTVETIDPSVTITNHHPVLHTLLLGTLTKLGTNMGSTNAGIFLYTLLQSIVLILSLSYTIYYMKKLGTPYFIRIIIILIYALVPVFPLYAMSTVKDVYFASFIILYSCMLFDLIKNNGKLNNKKMIIMILLSILISLTRNNGIYLILLSLPFILLIKKSSKIKIIIMLVLIFTSYYSFNNIILKHFKISSGSPREALSIPFQQTARLAKEKEYLISEEDKKIIDKVLDYDTLVSRYLPTFADTVKNEYNPHSTKEDLSEYLKVWFKGLTKAPLVYISSTLNNTYGYFYPNTSSWYIYYKYDTKLKEEGLVDYHYNSLDINRKILSSYALAFPSIPLLGLIVNVGFSAWILLFMFCVIIIKKKYKYLIYLLPSLSLFLVCIASPVNTYFRYALPNIFAIPILICMLINILKQGREENEEKK